MIEPTIVEHGVVASFTLAYPLYSALTWPGFVRAARAGTPGVRMRTYAEVLVVQWTLTAVLLWSWAGSGRPWAWLGVSMPGTAGWIGLAIAAALWGAVLVQLRGLGTLEPKVAASLHAQLGDVALFLPHTHVEHRTFHAVSVTAGFCEEVMFRGFLPLYLLTWLPAPWAWLVAVLAFGLGHAYQGPRGILKTGIVGAILAGITVLTGSLWIAIALHVLMDVQGGTVGHALHRTKGPESVP